MRVHLTPAGIKRPGRHPMYMDMHVEQSQTNPDEWVVTNVNREIIATLTFEPGEATKEVQQQIAEQAGANLAAGKEI